MITSKLYKDLLRNYQVNNKSKLLLFKTIRFYVVFLMILISFKINLNKVEFLNKIL